MPSRQRRGRRSRRTEFFLAIKRREKSTLDGSAVTEMANVSYAPPGESAADILLEHSNFEGGFLGGVFYG